MMGRVFFTLAIFLLSSSHAVADRFYAGGNVAVSNFEDSALGLTFQDRPVGLRLNAGYEFSGMFALEGSYVDTGKADDTFEDVSGNVVSADAKLTGYVLSLVIRNEDLSPHLFTKLGYYNGELEGSGPGIFDGEFDGSLPRILIDDDEDGFAASVGFRHGLATEHIAIRGEIEWIESDVLDNLWSIGIGVEFSFGD